MGRPRKIKEVVSEKQVNMEEVIPKKQEVKKPGLPDGLPVYVPKTDYKESFHVKDKVKELSTIMNEFFSQYLISGLSATRIKDYMKRTDDIIKSL